MVIPRSFDAIADVIAKSSDAVKAVGKFFKGLLFFGQGAIWDCMDQLKMTLRAR